MTNTPANDWSTYQRLVLTELKRLDSNLEKLTDRIEIAIKHERANRMQVERSVATELRKLALDVNTLKLKCGLYGLLGGLLPVLTALLMKQL